MHPEMKKKVNEPWPHSDSCAVHLIQWQTDRLRRFVYKSLNKEMKVR